MNRFQQQVITAAQQGTLVLTANKRLFRSLRETYDRQMQSLGCAVWPTAQIYSCDGWLHQCLQQLGEGWRLLSLQQQRHLWQELIAGAVRGSALELMNLEQTTETAVRAHNLLAEYRLALDAEQLTEDQQAFAGWRRDYLRRCRQQQWLDQGTLAQRIIEGFSAGHLTLPGSLLLVGFDQLPAGIQALVDSLRSLGTQCRVADPITGDAGRVIRFSARDEQHEIETMARWVRLQLEQGATSIGVVVPDLSRKREQLERILRQQIDPPSAAVLADGETAFGLSLGSPLAGQGVIAGALAGLEAQQLMTLDQISFLLRSPFMAGSFSEADQRALFDQRLRSFKQENFQLRGLLQLAQRFERLPILQQLLTVLIERSRQSLTPEQWAEVFADELKGLGWPGEARLSSTSYQAVKAWYDKVLTGLAGLDSVASPVSRQRALSIVKQLARETEFQPESVTGPVQVVGLLESSGLTFAQLWVMGLGEGVIPAAPRPNPFIPYRMQEQFQLPHATFSRELDFAEQVLLRLRHAAPDIVFSYPRRSGDCELGPSRLISHIGEAGEPPLFAPQDLVTRLRATAPLERWSDSRGPVLAAEHSVGGTTLLKDQAHCPFRAFAHHRLRVKAFEQVHPGLSPGVRGDLVHLSLQRIWAQLRDQATLLCLDSESRRLLLETAVDQSLNSYFERRSEPPAALLQLERQRIIQLMDEWFDEVEIPRQNFTVVATEQQQRVAIGGLRLQLVVDRIDCLANGAQVIIDYKTGAQIRVADFLTEPLLEPQLPSYAVAGGAASVAIKGIAIAKVRRGDCRLLGIVNETGVLGNVRGINELAQTNNLKFSDWEGLLRFWQQQLEQLAADFCAGIATVTPYDPALSCRFCDLPGICRIGALEQEEDGDAN